MDEQEGKRDIIGTLRKAIEVAQPNLRSYYRAVRKAKVVASYASDGQYYCDVQPLKNDETADENEPVIPAVAIPVMWGGRSAASSARRQSGRCAIFPIMMVIRIIPLFPICAGAWARMRQRPN